VYQAANSRGEGTGAFCASDVSEIIAGIPYFSEVKRPTRFIPKYPATLLDEVVRSPILNDFSYR